MDDCQWSLSLVIPAYNEEAGIHQAIAEADAALAELAHDYEILIVDDGSRDRTAIVVAEAAQTYPHVRLLQHPENRGYGTALRTGFTAARFDRVAFTDADCQFHLADLAHLLPLTEQAPLAVGYRQKRQDPWQRRFFSWGYNTFVRALLGTRVRDCDCALKVFRKEAVQHLLPETRGFFVNTEMLTRARQLGYEVAEAGVRHRPRLRGVSKVSLWDIPRTLQTLLPFWWSQVLFPQYSPVSERVQPASPRPLYSGGEGLGVRGCILPGRKTPSPQPLSPEAGARGFGATGWGLLALVVLCLVLFFGRLGWPLQEPEEPRYAEIPRQMLAAGSWAVPLLHGEPYYDKPPLLYWLVMASYRVFGVQDWAARLVPSAAAFLTVLLTYFWGRRLVGHRAALAAAFILCLSARFVYLGRLLTMNGLLCLWVVAALAAAHLAVAGPRFRRGWWLLSATACGLGLLTKGPVALVLVAVPIVLYLLLDARAVRPAWRWRLAYPAVALGLAAPWYITIAWSDPSFVQYFFWRQNLVRYVAPFDHAKPAWYYVGDVVLGMLPWSLLLLPLLKFLGRPTLPEATKRPAALGYFLLAGVWSFVFFSLAGSKRAGYILPAMPPLALALGCYVDAIFESEERLPYRLTLFVLVAGIVGSFLTASAGLLRPGAALVVAAVSTLLLAGVLARGIGRRPARSWISCGGVTFALLLAGLQFVLPGYARRYSLRAQVRPVALLAQDAEVPVVSYPRGWDSISFYLGREDVRVYTPAERRELVAELQKNSRTLAFIKSDHSLTELLHDLSGSLEFVPRGRQGNVAVGWVQPRREVPSTLFAERRLQ
jgi:dolichol-phosphate mannosyltransferase